MLKLLISYFQLNKPIGRLSFTLIMIISYFIGGYYLASIIPLDAIQKFQETGESPFAFFEPTFHQKLFLFIAGAITFPAYVKRFLDIGAKRPQTYTLILLSPLILKTLLSQDALTTLSAPIFIVDMVGFIVTITLMVTVYGKRS